MEGERHRVGRKGEDKYYLDYESIARQKKLNEQPSIKNNRNNNDDNNNRNNKSNNNNSNNTFIITIITILSTSTTSKTHVIKTIDNDTWMFTAK